MDIKRLNNGVIIIMLIIVFSSLSIFANDQFQDDKKVTEFSSTLTQKLLLNSEQELKVTNILSDLQKNILSKPDNKSEYLKDAQSKLESILDNKQKMKYDIIKNDLWKKF